MYNKNGDKNMFFRIVQTIPANYYRFFDVNADSKEEAIQKCKNFIDENEEENTELENNIQQDVFLTGFEFDINEDEEPNWDVEEDDTEGGVTVMGGFPPLFLN